MYKLIKNRESGQIEIVFNKQTKQFIPLNTDNKAFWEYKKWLEDGNTPEPADE